MRETGVLPLTPEVKETVRRFAETMTGWQVKDTHIKKIKVHAFSPLIKRPIDSDICVGQELDGDLSGVPHEKVLAIFESNEYLVVTPNRNSLEGTVYFFEPREVSVIEKDGS